MRDLSEILDDVLNINELSRAKATGEKKGPKIEDVAHDTCDLIKRLATDLSPAATFQIACSSITALQVHHKVMITMAENIKDELEQELLTDEYGERTIESANDMGLSCRLAAIKLLGKVQEGIHILQADGALLGQALKTVAEIDPQYPKPPETLVAEFIDGVQEEAMRSIKEKEDR